MSLPSLPRRQLLHTLAAGALVAPLIPSWAAPSKSEPYQEVKPIQPTENAARIEVVDFFWYGCSHCNNFLPHLAAWKKKLPADVSYRYLPVAFDARNEPHSRLFYTLEALGKVEELHAKVFAAMHNSPKRALLKPEEIADFAAAQGIDRKLWLDTFMSFSVQARAKRALSVWQGYKIDGTPSLGIDGRYWTSPANAGGAEAALKVADELIEQVRRQRSGRK